MLLSKSQQSERRDFIPARGGSAVVVSPKALLSEDPTVLNPVPLLDRCEPQPSPATRSDLLLNCGLAASDHEGNFETPALCPCIAVVASLSPSGCVPC